MVKEKVTFATLPATPKIKQQVETIKEWGNGKFTFREILAEQHTKASQVFAEFVKKDPSNLSEFEAMVMILSVALFDEDGNNPELSWLLKQPMALIQRLGRIALDLNGMSAAAQAQAEKN